MSKEIWFQEELGVPKANVETFTKAAMGLGDEDLQHLAEVLEISIDDLQKGKAGVVSQALVDKLRGTIEVHKPICRPLTQEEAANQMIKQGHLVKFGAEFRLTELRGESWQFMNAWFRTRIYEKENDLPRVVAVLPERLYGGEPRKIALKLKPSLGVSEVKAEIGEAGIEMSGQIAPVMLGFHGEAQRMPYWEIRRGDKPIEGIYNFWAIVEATQEPLELSILAEADLQVTIFTFPVGPVERAWDKQRKIVLSEV